MPRFELLNNVAHKDLRVATGFGPQYGDDVGMVPAFPSEFAELQREYPIFLRKEESGLWQSVALLGFEQRENLYLANGKWNATYLPGAAAKGPFAIGFQSQRIEGEMRQEPVMHVDVEHPRVNDREGEPVFLPQGGNTPYLDHVAGVLRGIRDGMEFGSAMFAAFEALQLIQPVNLDVRLDGRHRVSVGGLYSIDREKLSVLGGSELAQLNRAGYLEGAYLVLASMHNMRRLMAEKQRRVREQGEAGEARG